MRELCHLRLHAKNPSDKRLVYLAFKNLFKGLDAQLHTTKKRSGKLMQKHLDNRDGAVRALVAEHNIETPRGACFKPRSPHQPKRRSPEVSPAHSVPRDVKQQEVIRLQLETLLRGIKGHELQRNLALKACLPTCERFRFVVIPNRVIELNYPF